MPDLIATFQHLAYQPASSSPDLIVRAWAQDAPTDASSSDLRSRLQNALDAIPAAPSS